MKYEVMKEWVKSLRSGNYTQGEGKLKTVNNDYCCLGVLCEMSGIGKWSFHRGINKYEDDYTSYDCEMEVLQKIHKHSLDINNDGLHIPKQVMEWSGMKTDGGCFNYFDGSIKTIELDGEVFSNLADLNDGGASFIEIADIIEREWENL